MVVIGRLLRAKEKTMGKGARAKSRTVGHVGRTRGQESDPQRALPYLLPTQGKDIAYLCHAEIGYLYLPLSRQQEIARLDVAVDDPTAVQVLKAADQLHKVPVLAKKRRSRHVRRARFGELLTPTGRLGQSHTRPT